MPSLTVSLSVFSVVLLMCLPYSDQLPTALRKQLFDLESSDTSSPEFARPDENADLQRNSARLHRTLFLLDTSDLLKNAKLLSEKVNGKQQQRNGLGSRSKRDANNTPKKYGVRGVRVRKPTLSIIEDRISSHRDNRSQ